MCASYSPTIVVWWFWSRLHWSKFANDRFLVEQGRAEVRYLWCFGSLGSLSCKSSLWLLPHLAACFSANPAAFLVCSFYGVPSMRLLLTFAVNSVSFFQWLSSTVLLADGNWASVCQHGGKENMHHMCLGPGSDSGFECPETNNQNYKMANVKSWDWHRLTISIQFNPYQHHISISWMFCFPWGDLYHLWWQGPRGVSTSVETMSKNCSVF